MELPTNTTIRWRTEEEADEFQEQWDLLHRRFGPHPHAPERRLADICRAYEEATGTLTGCD
jgi:hypothetical protein